MKQIHMLFLTTLLNLFAAVCVGVGVYFPGLSVYRIWHSWPGHYLPPAYHTGYLNGLMGFHFLGYPYASIHFQLPSQIWLATMVKRGLEFSRPAFPIWFAKFPRWILPLCQFFHISCARPWFFCSLVLCGWTCGDNCIIMLSMFCYFYVWCQP